MRGGLPCKGAGFSLVELMIAMVLGLLVVGAAIGIFISNRQTYSATENLGRVQEGVRTAFELMSRDVREAAGNPCVNNLPLANVLNSSASNWWSNINQWGDAFRGYGPTEVATGLATGSGSTQRVTNTEVLQLFAADENAATISVHDPVGAKFTVNTASHGIASGDLAVACDSRQASIFQVSSVAGQNIFHAAGGTPGNCTTGLGVPLSCGAGTVFTYAAPSAVVVRLHATRWYIGNGANGPSLYQQVATANGTVTTQEVAEGVSNLSVLYLVSGQSSYRAATALAAGDWANVTAARITLQLVSTDGTGTGGQAIQRQLIHVVSLRNRNP
ncbi:type IV pilus assembly protein PilW [Xanthomonas hyacinthi]|uniref:Type IV pilus assembly protein PilW n=3 Tax=Xanthomonas hyacinthi TaxID=56455 RepID=A0A2S7ES97_9XANT|nr:PilW family protein [Xanthomonas hyacinthi]PPU95985.1 hypothetical protein XhyaCFBP1156_17115 [Xanthomonas hyacinthi]QGY75261.1 type IV pilus assembly protein PilW [Xanthomonas hyacinthi]